jgi:sulfur carrier protein ThiS
MEITLNNTREIIPEESISVADLILLKNYTFRMLVTKVNGQLVRERRQGKGFYQDRG